MSDYVGLANYFSKRTCAEVGEDCYDAIILKYDQSDMKYGFAVDDFQSMGKSKTPIKVYELSEYPKRNKKFYRLSKKVGELSQADTGRTIELHFDPAVGLPDSYIDTYKIDRLVSNQRGSAHVYSMDQPEVKQAASRMSTPVEPKEPSAPKGTTPPSSAYARVGAKAGNHVQPQMSPEVCCDAELVSAYTIMKKVFPGFDGKNPEIKDTVKNIMNRTLS